MLDEQTELATKTGMNADYIPGMATVLSGDDLLARGVRSVWEALALVPGFTQGIEVTGERQVLSRGVGFGYASGQIKVLLDGVSMNSTLAATANPVMNIPIEQVARIEVIRGPGASVYGEFAYAGVVNVITRQQARSLHGQVQVDPHRRTLAGGGGVWTWEAPAHELTASINVTGLTGDGGAVAVQQDALYPLGRRELSFAPGPVNDAQRFGGLFAELHWRNRFATVKLLDDAYGDQFGINHFLPPPDQGLVSTQRNLVVELGQDMQLSETLSARLRLEGQQYERKRDGLYVFPAGYLTPPPAPASPDGPSVSPRSAEAALAAVTPPLSPSVTPSVAMDQRYRETRYVAALDLHWRPGARHRLLFGLEASQIDVREANWDWQGLPAAIARDWLDTDTDRRILSAIVQDAFRVNDQVTLTGSLRLDDYSDLDTYWSPRLAAVWRLNAAHVLKFQFARAFRPPTFYELAYPSAAPLKTSEITTVEVGYILKQPAWEGRLILFHSALRGPISFDYDRLDGFANGEDATLRGVELEFQQRLGRRVRIDANLSYVEATRDDSGAALPGGTDLLANLALLVRVTPAWTTALQARYVGERQRVVTDPRTPPWLAAGEPPGLASDRPLAAQASMDLTLNYRPGRTGPSLAFGIKNLTDADLRFPQSPTEVGGVALTYPDDYPQPGRQWWLSLGYAF